MKNVKKSLMKQVQKKVDEKRARLMKLFNEKGLIKTFYEQANEKENCKNSMVFDKFL